MIQNSPVSRRALSKLAVAGIGAVGATCLATSSAQAATSDIISVPDAQRLADTQKLLSLINEYRAQNGLGALKHSATVATVMEGETRRQFTQGYFSHSNQFLNDSRVQGWSNAREVIALSYQVSVDDLIAFWKSSPAHNAAILHPDMNVCGIGFSYGSGEILPWKILGNVALYQYAPGMGPNDYVSSVSGVVSNASSSVQVTNSYAVATGAISNRYYADGGASHYGQPTGNPVALAGGTAQSFNNNGVSWTIIAPSGSDAYSIYEPGAIANFWRSKGSENSYMGYPIMNEKGGLVGGGAYQIFRNGWTTQKVLWHPEFGTQSVYENGAIGAEWARQDFERGLGYPLTGEYLDGVEMKQQFSNGYTIAWHSFTGAVRVFATA